MRFSFKGTLWAILLLGVGEAQAQSAPTTAVDSFSPAERGSHWFAAESLGYGRKKPIVLGATGDYGHHLLVLKDGAGNDLSTIVKDQLFLHLGASWVPIENLRVGYNVPIALISSGDSIVVGNTAYNAPSGAAMGDQRIRADYRFFGADQGVLRLAVGLGLRLPTGKVDAYTSEGSLRFQPRFSAAGDLNIFTWSAGLGMDIRTRTHTFDGITRATDVTYVVAAGVRLLDDRLVVGPELYGATGINSDAVFFKKAASPLELVFGGHFWATPELMVGAAVGPGLTTGYGVPSVRALASIDWTPQFADTGCAASSSLDQDHDGISDQYDACVGVPGVASSVAHQNGCPLPPKDSDNDGVPDERDACPNVAGQGGEAGCPPKPKDSDGDGIADDQDMCPGIAGVASRDVSMNGCPEPVKDSDGDGVTDDKDACPKDKGEASSDTAKNGCPKAVLKEDKIVILDRVEFETSLARIKPESDGVLDAVRKVLVEHPEITGLSIEGHTDNRGNAAMNKTLSQDRANAVLRWLVSHGIEAKRLRAAGFGSAKPIDNNDTESGRQNNRRVEFHVLSSGNDSPATTKDKAHH